MQQNIELHIEKLVLYGFTGYNGYQIVEIVEREIARMFREQGLPVSLSVDTNLGQLNAGIFNMSQGARAEVLGNNIAQSLYKGLQNEKSGPLKNGK